WWYSISKPLSVNKWCARRLASRAFSALHHYDERAVTLFCEAEYINRDECDIDCHSTYIRLCATLPTSIGGGRRSVTHADLRYLLHQRGRHARSQTVRALHRRQAGENPGPRHEAGGHTKNRGLGRQDAGLSAPGKDKLTIRSLFGTSAYLHRTARR